MNFDVSMWLWQPKVSAHGYRHKIKLRTLKVELLFQNKKANEVNLRSVFWEGTVALSTRCKNQAFASFFGIVKISAKPKKPTLVSQVQSEIQGVPLLFQVRGIMSGHLFSVQTMARDAESLKVWWHFPILCIRRSMEGDRSATSQ